MKNQDIPGTGFPLRLSLPPSHWFAGTSVPHFWFRSFCFIRYRSTRRRSQSARKGRYQRERPHPENVRYIVTIFRTTLQRFESASIYITSDSFSRWLRKNLENIAPFPQVVPSCELVTFYLIFFSVISQPQLQLSKVFSYFCCVVKSSN